MHFSNNATNNIQIYCLNGMFDPIHKLKITSTMLQLSQIRSKKNFQYPIYLSQKIIFLQIYWIKYRILYIYLCTSHIIDILNFDSQSISHTAPHCYVTIYIYTFRVRIQWCVINSVYIDGWIKQQKNQSIENFIFRIVAQGFIGSLQQRDRCVNITFYF